MSDFRAAFERTFGFEGGYVNDPDDPGGETKWGISKRSYPHLDIKNLTRPQAEEIYLRDYWSRLRLDEVLDANIAAEMFDTGVNCGLSSAVTIAQRTCNALGSHLVVDSYIGPMTLRALNDHARRHRDTLLVTLNCLQAARYVELTEVNEKKKKYFRGWINHRVQLRAELLEEKGDDHAVYSR